MTYIPRRTTAILNLFPDTPFHVADLKEHLNGGTLARLKNAGYIAKVSQKQKIITWKITEKGQRRRAQR